MKGLSSWKRFNLPVELRLILACLRITPSKKEVQQIEAWSSAKIDWPDFLRWVDRHRVAPLVYQNLRRHGGNGVPASVMSALRSRFEANARRSLANARELVRLAKLFQENGLTFIPLKGSVLALQVYGNLAGRHAGDIDLLVEPDQVELADLLLQTSYRRIMPDFQPTPLLQQRFLRFMRHFIYQRDRGMPRIELHWRSMGNQPPHGQGLTRLHSRAAPVAVADSTLPALSFPDNLLYLCGHGAGHSWSRLFWLVDLAEIIRGNPQIDWQNLMTLARESGMMRPLAQGTILAHELLDVPLPEAMRTYVLQDQMVSHAARLAHRFMLYTRPDKASASLILDRCFYNLRCAHSFQEKLKALQEIFIGIDWMTIRLPNFLFFLYYLLRVPRWLQRKLAGTGKPMVP